LYQGFKPLSIETYIDRVPIGVLACRIYPLNSSSFQACQKRWLIKIL